MFKYIVVQMRKVNCEKGSRITVKQFYCILYQPHQQLQVLEFSSHSSHILGVDSHCTTLQGCSLLCFEHPVVISEKRKEKKMKDTPKAGRVFSGSIGEGRYWVPQNHEVHVPST